jgi:SAM-dependent methyltransferase
MDRERGRTGARMTTPPVSTLDTVYQTRFDERARQAKMEMWAEIARYLQQYVLAEEPLLDIACDAGYFVRNVRASERWATDIRDVSDLLPPDVRFSRADGLSLHQTLPLGYFGTVFMSNYLEHLTSPDAVIEQLRIARELLQPGGRLIVLQPNIRLTGGSYWDFIDHRVALTERSLVEAGEIVGLRVVKVITRFLPFTTKSRLPQSRRLVRLYLSIPLAWRYLGQQSLYVAEPR